MKATSIVAAAVVASLGFSSVSFAQGWRDRGDHPGQRAHERRLERVEPRHERRMERVDARHDRRHDRQDRWERRQDRHDARDWRHERRYHVQPVAPVYQSRPSYHVQPVAPVYQSRPSYHWRPAPYYAPRVHYTHAAPRYYYRGDRLPVEYRRHMVVVNDWNTYGLYAPPYGHQWVRSDTGEILLIALATGIIANLLLR
jgi:Ni/Co efflux regulator RcnB